MYMNRIYNGLGWLLCEIAFCGYDYFDYECWEWKVLGWVYDKGCWFYGKVK